MKYIYIHRLLFTLFIFRFTVYRESKACRVYGCGATYHRCRCVSEGEAEAAKVRVSLCIYMNMLEC